MTSLVAPATGLAVVTGISFRPRSEAFEVDSRNPYENLDLVPDTAEAFRFYDWIRFGNGRGKARNRSGWYYPGGIMVDTEDPAPPGVDPLALDRCFNGVNSDGSTKAVITRLRNYYPLIIGDDVISTR